MIDSVGRLVMGALVRGGEAVADSAATLIIGLGVAAVLRFYVGDDGTRRLFGGKGFRSLVQSWAVGMILPVCSVGVIPILFQMRRARVSPGALSAFALSAPLFNPLSLLYGLTLSRPYVIVFFAAGSLAVVTGLGWVWDRWCSRHREPAVEPENSPMRGPIGVQRLMASVVYAARCLSGMCGAVVSAALVGAGVWAAVFPNGQFQHAMGRDDPMAPLRMVFVTPPVYATPLAAMGRLGMMFQHANSPGAAFILLVLGAGMNVGTLVFMAIGGGRSGGGVRAATVWTASLLVIVLAIAYAVNRPLIPPGVEPSGHTHAFDVYTNPFHRSLEWPTWEETSRKLGEAFGVLERIPAAVLAAMFIVGVLLRIVGVDEHRWDGAADEPSKARTAGRFDRIVSPRVVGATAIGGLVALSVVMSYAFYPSPRECLEEIRFIKADVLGGATSGDAEHALFWKPRWDDWSRRAEVGAIIRRGHLTPYQRVQGRLLREKLEVLKHELKHEVEFGPSEDRKTLKRLVSEIFDTHQRWATAYRDPFDPSQRPVVRLPDRPVAEASHRHRHLHGDGHRHDHTHDDEPAAGEPPLVHQHSHHHDPSQEQEQER